MREIDILKSKHFGTAGYVISHGAAKYLMEVFEKFPQKRLNPLMKLYLIQLIDCSIDIGYIN